MVMTLINFFITAFGAPITMAFYRHFRSMDKTGVSETTGSVFSIIAFGSCFGILVNMVFYDSIAHAWRLTMHARDYFFFLCYMLFFILDSFLLARIQLDFEFRKGFITRVIFFMASLLVIPAFKYYNAIWMMSFILAPGLSTATLLYFLLHDGKISLRQGISFRRDKHLFSTYAVFLLSTISSQLLIYCDRWILAFFNISKSDIAYYTIAVQACTLILYPVDRIGELMMPTVSNLESMEQISKQQARKSLFALLGSIVYISTAGILIGHLFFKLYNPIYLEQGWNFFIVLIIGVMFYPLYIFSRAFLISHFPASSILKVNILAVITQVVVSTVLMFYLYNARGVAIGKTISFIVMAAVSINLCQYRLIKLAW